MSEQNVPDIEISLDRLSRTVDEIKRAQEKTHSAQQETHKALSDLANHYEKTRKVGFMEKINSLDPKVVLTLIGLAGAAMGGITHVGHTVANGNGEAQVESAQEERIRDLIEEIQND